MTTWMLAHPWMMFWIVILLILIIDNQVGNYYLYKSGRFAEKDVKKEKPE